MRLLSVPPTRSIKHSARRDSRERQRTIEPREFILQTKTRVSASLGNSDFAFRVIQTIVATRANRSEGGKKGAADIKENAFYFRALSGHEESSELSSTSRCERLARAARRALHNSSWDYASR